MHTDSDEASQSFDTVREPESSAVRSRNPPNTSHSGQKCYNASALHRGSLVVASSNKQSRTEDQDMSPRFLTGKENTNHSNASQKVVRRLHSKSNVSASTEHSILMSLPREDIVQLVMNTRRQIKQYVQVIEDKDAKLAKLKTKCHELSKELDKVSSNNEKLVEYIRQQIAERDSPKGLQRNESSGKQKTHSTKLHTSSLRESPSHQELDSTTSELMVMTDSDSPDELLSKVRTLKQSSKFVCSLYKLIDQYTQDKYFGGAYSLSSAWSFVKKLFKEYFDESWMQLPQQFRKSNSVVGQLEQLLNCQRDQLNNRVLGMMRSTAKLNQLVERFKIDSGLFWINDLEELEKHLDSRDRRYPHPSE